jgi:hypothetical protein
MLREIAGEQAERNKAREAYTYRLHYRVELQRCSSSSIASHEGIAAVREDLFAAHPATDGSKPVQPRTDKMPRPEHLRKNRVTMIRFPAVSCINR